MAASAGRAPSMGHRSPVSMVRGFAGGIAAFVVTYGFLFVARGNAVGSALGQSFDTLSGTGLTPADWQVIGWVFFEAHNVRTTASISSLGRTERLGQGLDGAAAWDASLLLVPVVVLLVAGFLVANSTVASRLGEGFKAGAAIVLGYLVMTVVGMLLFYWTTTISGVTVSVGPHYVTAFLFAGLAYPIILGGIGGAMATQI